MRPASSRTCNDGMMLTYTRGESTTELSITGGRREVTHHGIGGISALHHFAHI
jgi:hypothetical protein